MCSLEGYPREQRGPITENATFVDLSNGKIGREIKKPGQFFELKNIFGSRVPEGGWIQLLFRTESENIYCLNKTGELISLRASEQQGEVVGRQLNREVLARQKLTIREPFRYTDNISHTTRITEIVLVDSNVFDKDRVKKLTRGKTNNISNEFEARLPQKNNYKRYTLDTRGVYVKEGILNSDKTERLASKKDSDEMLLPVKNKGNDDGDDESGLDPMLPVYYNLIV